MTPPQPSDLRQASSTPALKEAVDITLRAIERRTSLYRKLVVSIAVLSIASILLSIILLSWIPACGLVLIAPLTGAFLFLDSRQVRRWQAVILEMWRLRNLNLNEFETMISSFRHVPPQSLHGMLSTLPKDSGEFKRDQASEEEKALCAQKIEALGRQQEQRTLAGAAALTMMLLCLIGAARFRSVALLFCFASLAAILILVRRK